MSQKNMWIWLVLLAGVIGLWWYLDNRPAPESETPEATAVPTPAFLFVPESSQIVNFTLQDADGNYVFLERGAGGAWMLNTSDYKGIADQAQSEAAATQVSALRVLSTLDESPALDSIGLDNPTYTLVVVTTATKQSIAIGAATVTGSGYYVMDGIGQVSIVSKYGVDALLNLLILPPYAATPTPAVTPTP